MIIRREGVLAGVVVFVIAIAAFVMTDRNGNNLHAAQTEHAEPEVPIPIPTRTGLLRKERQQWWGGRVISL